MRRALFATTVLFVAIVACGKRNADVPPPSWEPDRSCASKDDCTPVPSCCPAPCVGDAINKRDYDKLRARVESTCNKEDCKNIVAGSCLTHDYLCVRGKCAFVTEGSPDWPDAGAVMGR